jgi:hypothetical protein
MSEYAQIDNNGIVQQILVVDNSIQDGQSFLAETCGLGGTWVESSPVGAFRKNPAGIGFTYDVELDAFISPKPYLSWLFDSETCQWKAPTPYPSDGLSYIWNEQNVAWEIVNLGFGSSYNG